MVPAAPVPDRHNACSLPAAFRCQGALGQASRPQPPEMKCSIQAHTAQAHLAGAADLHGALVPPAALGQVAGVPAPGALVHQREPVEGSHHPAVAGADHPLGVVVLPCARAGERGPICCAQWWSSDAERVVQQGSRFRV